MSVTVQWHNTEKSVLIMKFSGVWTWGQLYLAHDELKSMIDTVEYHVPIIYVWEDGAVIPLNAVSKALSMAKDKHPRAGEMVVVGANASFMALWKVFITLAKFMDITLNFSFVHSMDEALATLSVARQ